ncbi:FlaD/FlaE family flagellar protein [Halalkalicoccus subterraneus]|uniref:FlaD/FlaE family flagellar protein n=1 Tax=Halalkalicoccus subterraneus TaxID=2675002 RepID=UPI000EFD40FB|nr:FlaD/FlaE family flagellar protein [Halalkalicoccus subterraneus]
MSLFDRLRSGGDEEGTASDQPATDGGSESDDPFDEELNGEMDETDGFDDLSMGEDSEEYADEEFERRIDEIETELASVSSTVNTIRSENEEMSEAVSEIEENIRKLLNVYEMVTRGINPFTDDEVDMGGAGGSIGLFDDGEDDDLDADVASADAESFFDDDLDDDGVDPAVDGNEEDASTGFDDLKDEYESGDADWDEAVEDAESERVEGTLVSIDSELTYAERTLSDAPEAEKPYLRGTADGYVADLLILEWLEHLVETAGLDAAEDAFEYYESIQWIDGEAADQLRAFVDGFDADEDEVDDGKDDPALSVADHTQSLRYICQLSSGTSASVVLDGWNDESRRAQL